MRKIYWLLLLGIVVYHPLKAKINKDSLVAAVQLMKADTNKVLTYVHIGIYFKQRMMDSSIYYFNQAIALADQLNYAHGKCFALLEEGLFRHNSKRYRDAISNFHKARYIIDATDNSRLKPFVNLSLATSHMRLATRDSAFYYYKEAEKAFETIGKPYPIWQVYFGLGSLYTRTGNYNNAQKNMEMAYDMVQPTNNRIDKGYVLFHLGELYFITNNYNAYKGILEDWAAFNNKGKNKEIDANSPSHAVYFSFFTKDDSLSLAWLENALDHFRTNKDTIGISWSFQNLGFHYDRVGNKDYAYTSYLAALPFMKRNNEYGDMITVYAELYDLAKTKSAYQDALEHLERYQYYRDSLQTLAMQNRLQDLEVRYEIEKKERQLEIQELNLQRRTLQRNALFGSSIFIGILAIMIVFGYRTRLQANAKLTSQQLEIQDQRILQLQQEKRLLAFTSMIEGQESERMRIAGDLHDGIGSLLTTIKAHLGALEPVTQSNQTGIYNKANHLIDETCTEVRRIAQNMMPKTLLIAGLKDAIEDMVIQLQTNGLNCNLEIVGGLEELTQHQAVTIYRIIQELTQNIMKHAEAEHVLLQLIKKDNELSIIIEDDGKGFNLKQALQKKSLGLKSISSRVEVLEGKLDIDTVLGEGTTINIQLPIKEKL